MTISLARAKVLAAAAIVALPVCMVGIYLAHEAMEQNFRPGLGPAPSFLERLAIPAFTPSPTAVYWLLSATAAYLALRWWWLVRDAEMRASRFAALAVVGFSATFIASCGMALTYSYVIN